MEFEPAFPAPEIRTVTVPLVGMPAHRTFLRGVTGVDKDHLLAKFLGFVPDKLFQFIERPVVESPVELSASPFLDTDLAQVFKSKHRVAGVNDLLRDTVIDISHKPSFPTSDYAEFPPCRPGAFGLQLRTKTCIFCTCVLNRFGVKERVIGTYCDVDDTTVNTECREWFGDQFGTGKFQLNVQEKLSALFPVRESGRLNHAVQVLLTVFGNGECGFYPASDRCDGCDSVNKVNRDDPLIVTHGGEWYSFREAFALYDFQRITGAVSCALHQRGRKIWDRFTYMSVGCRMISEFVVSVILESPPGRLVEGSGVRLHRTDECRTTTFRQQEFECECPNHGHIYLIICEIFMYHRKSTEVKRAIPPRSKGRGFLAQLR